MSAKKAFPEMRKDLWRACKKGIGRVAIIGGYSLQALYVFLILSVKLFSFLFNPFLHSLSVSMLFYRNDYNIYHINKQNRGEMSGR